MKKRLRRFWWWFDEYLGFHNPAGHASLYCLYGTVPDFDDPDADLNW